MELRFYLKQHGVTQTEFADRLGMKYKVFNNKICRRGKAKFSVKDALHIEQKTDGEVDRYDILKDEALIYWPITAKKYKD